jgi:excisionase family DNA binding protein
MVAHQRAESAELLLPREVAQMFGVDAKTITRWANEGRLRSIRTIGGHRRFDGEQVRELAQQGYPPR